MGRVLPIVAAVFAFLAVFVCLGSARGQEHPTLSGTWSAGSLTENWSIGDWGDACGPKPKPQGAGAGSVQIREQGGELSVLGGGRAWSTSECWEQMPGLTRTSHSQSGGGRFWRTRCNTPANDPRRATVVTTVQATDSTMTLHETGQYQFVIHDTNCTASVTRSRSFTLMHREGDAAPAASASASAAPSATPPAATATPAKAAEPPTRACTGSSGEPARLEVRPARKLLLPGDKFTFRATVLDAEGCPVGVRPTWTVSPGPLAAKAGVDGTGLVSIAEDAGEGTLEVVATVAGKGVTVAIEVATPERFDALLAASGMNDAGETEQAAVVVIATGALAGERVVAEDLARKRRNLFVAIVGVLAGCLAIGGLLLARRARRAAASASANGGDGYRSMGSEPPDSDLGGTNEAAQRTSPGNEAAQRTSPGNEAAQRTSPGNEAPNTTVEVDSRHGEPLAPNPGKQRGKICPLCGEHFSPEASFCGKDGATLVLIN